MPPQYLTLKTRGSKYNRVPPQDMKQDMNPAEKEEKNFDKRIKAFLRNTLITKTVYSN